VVFLSSCRTYAFRDTPRRCTQSRTAAVDLPAPSATSATTIRIAGWAFRQVALDTVGTDAIDAWAYPAGGGAPIFVNSVMALVVFARNIRTQRFDQLRIVRVTVN